MKSQLILLFFSLSMFTVEAENVVVKVDVSTTKSFDKTKSLERQKFFNSHNSPGKEFSQEEWDHFNKIKMGVGRTFMLPNAGTLAASGTTDEQIKKQANNWFKYSKSYPTFSSDMMREVILTAHPTPGNGKDAKKQYAFYWKGKNADYSPEVKIIGSFLQHYFVDHNLELPHYIEPMNEPYVHASDYKRFGASDVDVRSEMARYHKAIAKEIHKNFPGVMVGGFASAWPFVEGFHSDFEHWNSRMKMFIDTVGSDLDFVSFHIYDGMNVTGGDCFRSGSNMEGIMDLIEGYCSIKFGKPLPLMISEHGMTRKDWITQPYSEERDWKILRSVNHQTIQFMQRPGNILKCIPFISGKALWRKDPNPYPWVTMRKDNNGNWVYTHLTKFYEFWKDISGKYTDAESSDIDVLSSAFVDGKKLYVVLNSLVGDKNIDLNLLNANNNKIKSVSVRSLYEKDARPVLEDKKIKGDANIKLLLRNDQTSIVCVEYKSKINQSNNIDNKKYYATEYLKPINKEVTNNFEVNIKSGKKRRALLQIGVARPHNLKVTPSAIIINGKSYKAPENWKGYDQSDRVKEGFFGVLDVPVTLTDLKEKNNISIVYNDKGGTISTVALNIDYIK